MDISTRFAIRRAWRIARDADNVAKLQGATLSAIEANAKEPINAKQLSSQSAPIKPKSKGKPPAPLRLLDATLKKARNGIGQLPTDAAEYAYVANGIEFLQAYRFALVGEYRPMELPTIAWTRLGAIRRAEKTT